MVTNLKNKNDFFRYIYIYKRRRIMEIIWMNYFLFVQFLWKYDKYKLLKLLQCKAKEKRIYNNNNNNLQN